MPGYRAGGTIAWRQGRAVAHETFLAQVEQLAATLPDAPRLINLCQDRYLFMLSLCAALRRGHSTLLPPNRLAATIRAIAADHPGCMTLADEPLEDLGLPHVAISEPLVAPGRPVPAGSPLISDRPDGIVAFTSGSTGTSQPNLKRWSDQMRCSAAAMARFGIGEATGMVATVPPQHMFGLELSVLIPMASGAAAHAGRPFFPDDIRAALAETPPPRVLVTTPVHLAACVKSDLDWPAIDFVISATAPLSEALAHAVETRLSTRVFEIYGCTEAGSVASRRTCEGPLWRWYDGVVPQVREDGVALTADFLPGEIPLNDRIEPEPDGRFRLLGRGSDLVNVAGKRASLMDLTLKLNAIPGVREGVILAPDGRDDTSARLAAVVVAPGLDRATLIARLRERMDPVFIPRPIVFVDALPRNDVGKTPRQWLLQLLDRARETNT